METAKPSTANKTWLTRNVVAIGLVSLFSDLGHETATTILPVFLATLGAAPWALGVIEGVSDALSSFSKLWSGWFCDRSGKRKPVAVTGYVLTGIFKATIGLATSWWHVLFSRSAAWMGRGARSPARDAILADSVEPAHYGKAFGLDRAMDTLGAILGPLAAIWLVTLLPYRQIFFITIIPGMLAAAIFAFVVRARRIPPNHSLHFAASLRGLPSSFRRFLVAVALFGIGDFAHTLLILRATQILVETHEAAKAAQLAMSLYVIHNVIYAAASLPVGALGDRWGKGRLLTLGYFAAVIMNLGFLFSPSGYWPLTFLFCLGGVFIAVEDALERALAAELLPAEIHATGFGVLATVNGLGDFVSSVVVGFLWAKFSPAAGFAYAAGFCLLGALMMWRLAKSRRAML
ncbi:MAG: MFS transporter [candidate division KSB1 bacterium]|nr:MFS transporter [candidate division KSB1 bacterium]MDZ7364609.1 MFS transporter [candidate division KSB1 bacterium]MDZ7402643.1 MFS transporter [candidate division KSB1 bacterium]